MRISSEQLEELVKRIQAEHAKSMSEFIRSAITDKLKKKKNEYQKN